MVIRDKLIKAYGASPIGEVIAVLEKKHEEMVTQGYFAEETSAKKVKEAKEGKPSQPIAGDAEGK